jgi:hypothetical protein
LSQRPTQTSSRSYKNQKSKIRRFAFSSISLLPLVRFNKNRHYPSVSFPVFVGRLESRNSRGVQESLRHLCSATPVSSLSHITNFTKGSSATTVERTEVTGGTDVSVSKRKHIYLGKSSNCRNFFAEPHHLIAVSSAPPKYSTC